MSGGDPWLYVPMNSRAASATSEDYPTKEGTKVESTDPITMILDQLARDIGGNVEIPWELIREALNQAYDAGYQAGWEDGYDACEHEYEDDYAGAETEARE